jgi:hypothetical protein
MRDYLTLLHSFTGKFTVGDFNSKNTYWGSRLTNANGSELYQAIREYHCEGHTTGKPTYWPTYMNKVLNLTSVFLNTYPVTSTSLKNSI